MATWKINRLDCAPMQGSRMNVVKVVHWTCEDTVNDVSASVYNTCTLPPPDTDFIAYNNLTQDTVLGWIWANGVHKSSAEAAVAQRIQDQITPAVVQPPLPW